MTRHQRGGSGRVESGLVWSAGVQTLTGQFRSGREVLKSRGSGRVGSGDFEIVGSGRVGSSRVGSETKKILLAARNPPHLFSPWYGEACDVAHAILGTGESLL